MSTLHHLATWVEGKAPWEVVLGEGLSLSASEVDLANGCNHGFSHIMRRVAIRICRKRGWVCSDDLRSVAKNYGVEPRNYNQWGPIFKPARWKSIGVTRTTMKEGRGRMIQMWKYKA